MLSHDEHYRAVFEASPDATLIVDSEGLILDANEQAVRMFGWSREALTGALVERLVPSSKRGAHLEHRAHYVRQPRSR
ncbi:MAG: PAS domain-containing protein, partial [Gammaproteobacteria bacterium]|nr:PAS domain-containing protein [Gammaproteobacteria bacterium]